MKTFDVHLQKRFVFWGYPKHSNIIPSPVFVLLFSMFLCFWVFVYFFLQFFIVFLCLFQPPLAALSHLELAAPRRIGHRGPLKHGAKVWCFTWLSGGYFSNMFFLIGQVSVFRCFWTCFYRRFFLKAQCFVLVSCSFTWGLIVCLQNKQETNSDLNLFQPEFLVKTIV